MFLGIGHWALGIGHWALEEYLTFLGTAIIDLLLHKSLMARETADAIQIILRLLAIFATGIISSSNYISNLRRASLYR